MEPWDISIIGGGILGTSIAYWLSNLFDARVAVFEKESEVAQHGSRRNTGNIHRPFYLDPKGRHVFAGSARAAYEMWKTYAKKRQLPWNPVGTFEIATLESQVPHLQTYYRWGLENGMLPDELELLTRDQVREHEPHVRCYGAIWSKTDTAVDFGRFTESLRIDAESLGAKFLMNSEVKTIRLNGNTLELQLAGRSESVKTRFLINCAGGNSIRVAHMMGVGREYTDLNFRGEYWNVRKELAMANHNIYTVPRHPDFPFLDPHWIIRADGRHEIGPNAVPVAGPYTYSGFFRNPSELIQKLFEPPTRNKLTLLFNPEFLTLAGEEWRSSISKSLMARRAQEFLPELKSQELTTPGTAGIRSAVIDKMGNFVKEALEFEGPFSYHITNYNSPGATGAPAYAAWIVGKLKTDGYIDSLKMKPNPSKSLWDFDVVCERVKSPDT